MNRFARLMPVLVLAFALPWKASGAEAVKFKHVFSLYADDKGAGLRHPDGVACNDRSLFVVADTGNGRLLSYEFADGSLRNQVEIKEARVGAPIKVQMNSKGIIYVLDGKERRVVRISPDGNVLGFVETGGVPSPSTVVPRSMKIDPKDNLYLLDLFGQRVIVLDPEGKFTRQIELPGASGFVSDIAIDVRGRVFAVDSVKGTVLSAAAADNTFSVLSDRLHEYSSFPVNMAVDEKGYIYVVDQDGGSVATLGPDGSFVGKQLGPGWREGQVYYPSQLCINRVGQLFLADRENSRIQIFTVSK